MRPTSSTKSGHYASWLREHHPEAIDLYEPEAVPDSRAEDLREVWKSAVPAELHYTNWIADRAVEFIKTRRDEPSPFCLFISFPDPHHPFAPPKPYCDLFQPSAMPRPAVREGELERMPAYLRHSDDPKKDAYIAGGEQSREQGFLLRTEDISDQTLAVAIAHTYGMVQMIDDAVGRILDAVSCAGASENTYVLFTSDHGELLGDHGLLRKGPPPYRQLLQVPLLISGPKTRPGTRSSALTSHVDLFATIASLLGVPAPPTDGLDLTPIIEGRAADVRDFLFAEYHPRKDACLYNQTIISKTWRFTRYPNEPAWGELFDLESPIRGSTGISSWRNSPKGRPISWTSILDRDLPPQPVVPGEILGAY